MIHKIEEYTCDNCGKDLPTCDNNMEIVTSKSEHNIGWSRLHVVIQHHHGSHNDDDIENCRLVSEVRSQIVDGCSPAREER